MTTKMRQLLRERERLLGEFADWFAHQDVPGSRVAEQFCRAAATSVGVMIAEAELVVADPPVLAVVPVDDATPMSDLDRPEIKQAAARCLADNIASRERDEEIRNNTKGGGQ